MSERLITSVSNPRLKEVLALQRRRRREETGTTLVEGYDEVRLALSAGVRPRQLLHCPELYAGREGPAQLLAQVSQDGTEVIRLSRAAFEKVAYREGADGVLAVLPSPGMPLRELPIGDRALVLVVEGVEKPGNLGAMLRTADAAGVDAVISADPVTDWGNPNVIRASKGTVFALPVATATLGETLGWLRDNVIALVAATPDTMTAHTDADLTGSVAVAVGTEKQGLTDAALQAADVRVAIPMAGVADSLNVATSAAVVLYEAVRQRRLPAVRGI